jgi:hypothetical protein
LQQILRHRRRRRWSRRALNGMHMWLIPWRHPRVHERLRWCQQEQGDDHNGSAVWGSHGQAKVASLSES